MKGVAATGESYSSPCHWQGPTQPLHDEFVDRANFFIDLSARDALGFHRPFCVYSHIDHHQDRVDDRIVRQMVRYPMIEKITAALARSFLKSGEAGTDSQDRHSISTC
jgi:hypothetical protein